MTESKVESIEVDGGTVRRVSLSKTHHYLLSDVLDILTAQYRKRTEAEMFAHPGMQMHSIDDADGTFAAFVPSATVTQFMPDGVAQRYLYSSAVASVAYMLGRSHHDTEKMFIDAKIHIGIAHGHSAEELLALLRHSDASRKYYLQDPSGYGGNPSTLPVGTFLLRKGGGWMVLGKSGWMDPWINYPCLEVRGEVTTSAIDLRAASALVIPC